MSETYSQLQKMEDVEVVLPKEAIPAGHLYYAYWKIKPVITTPQGAKRICLHMCFDAKFPYVWPDVYFYDKSYDYLSHIGYIDRKMCLYTDETPTSPDKPYEMINTTLKRACQLIERNVAGALVGDFANEILSYWRYQYDGEPKVVEGIYIGNLYNDGNSEYRLVTGNGRCYVYNVNDKDAQRIMAQTTIPMEKGYVPVILVSDYNVSQQPPYSISPSKLSKGVNDDVRNQIKSFIKKHKSETVGVLFPLPNTDVLGAVMFAKTKLKNNGFRTGKLSSVENWFVLHKNVCLPRYIFKPYSIEHITKRTTGKVMKKRNYWIGGLGSVGSNLVYYLNGELNVSFFLSDEDILTVDNIGRHLMGFEHVGKWKVDAVKEYLISRRPERYVSAMRHVVEDELFDVDSEYSPDALFLCTGNANSERYIIERFIDTPPDYPVFILWLEPYAIAGHMVYINPISVISYSFLNELYPYNLISRDEYLKEENLFTKQDAGCGNNYTNYGGSDVVLFLSAMYPIINQLLDNAKESTIYRWVGNVNMASDMNISLSEDHVIKGNVQNFPLLK